MIRTYSGLSWLSNLHGPTVDTVVAFEIVLPSGRILNVSANQSSDLFWGLKGGLNNFVRLFPTAQFIRDGPQVITLVPI